MSTDLLSFDGTGIVVPSGIGGDESQMHLIGAAVWAFQGVTSLAQALFLGHVRSSLTRANIGLSEVRGFYNRCFAVCFAVVQERDRALFELYESLKELEQEKLCQMAYLEGGVWRNVRAAVPGVPFEFFLEPARIAEAQQLLAEDGERLESFSQLFSCQNEPAQNAAPMKGGAAQ